MCTRDHKCITETEDADRKAVAREEAAAERRAREEAAAQKRRAADERLAAIRQQEKEKREEQRRATERRAAEAAFDKQLLATMNNKKETPAARAIAAIALGKDPSAVDLQKSATPDIAGLSRGQKPSAAERQLAKIALNQAQSTGPSSQQNSNEQLRAVYDNPNESKAARAIAAIALGKDRSQSGPGATTVAVVPAPPSRDGPSGQQSVLTPSLTNTATAQPAGVGSAASVRSGPSSANPQAATATNQQALSPSRPGNSPRLIPADPIATFYARPVAIGSATKIAVAQRPERHPDLWKSIQGIAKANERMLESRPGQVLVQTLAAAGDPVTDRYAPGLSKIGSAGDLAAAADSIRRKDYLSLAEQVADKVAVESAGAVGALLMPHNPVASRAIAAGSAQFVITSWKVYGAPAVGDELVRRFPQLFIPAPAVP